MAKTAAIEINNQDLLTALREFFKSILIQKDIRAILVPWQLPMKPMVMPTLIAEPDDLDRADPMSPAFPINSAKVLSRLTRKAAEGKVAAVLRSCEIRAFVELVKLNQGSMDALVLIGIDCLGAYSNTDFFSWAADDMNGAGRKFYSRVLKGNGAGDADSDLAPACRVCEQPIPWGADIAVGLLGVDTDKQFIVQSQTPTGDALIDNLALTACDEPPGRKKAVEQVVARRAAARDAMFVETHAATGNLEKLSTYLANCVNCYNCRVACPVCYCRECVFVTDVFDHEPSQYLRWAERKGAVKMPTDTIFYHMTRLTHMSTACVGCGQCSNACPNDIPVMELFRTIADKTQKGFEYEAGRSLDDKPPLSEFKEDEFPEVVGLN